MNIKEIAQLSGVSVATVSRVINGNQNVKPNIREKVEEIIKQNNYVPNKLGISLLKKKSNVIGVILPAVHSYYTERFNSIAYVCTDNGFEISVAVSDYSEPKELNALLNFLEKRVSGVIFMTTEISKNHIEIMKKYKSNIPIVVLDADASNEGFSSIIQDDYSGAKELMKYLVDNGHTKIAFISGGELNKLSTNLRFKAYEETMDFLGEAPNIVIGNYSIFSGYESIDKIIASKNIPTAIFAANDSMALGASRRLYELNYKIPDDISLLGVDDMENVKYMCPAALTTIKQELSESGKLAINMILEYLETGKMKFKKIVMEQRLVIRESVKNIKNPH